MELAFTSSAEGARVTMHAKGEIDVYTAPVLRKSLDQHLTAGARDVVMDLSEVTFMDSTGLGVLVGRLRFLRQHGGRLTLVVPTERLQKVFRITGLDQVFDIVHRPEDVPDPEPTSA